MQKVAVKNKLPLICLLIKNVRVCLPLGQVSKILPLMMLQAIPNSPPYVLGLLNLAGKSIPVIDLAVRLGFERDKPYSLDMPIILCTSESKELALLVDKVLGLADMEETNLQMQNQFNTSNSPFLGSVSIENKLSLLLNVKTILDINLMDAKNEQAANFKLTETTQYECENK